MVSIQKNNSKKFLMALGVLFSFVELVSMPMTKYEEAIAMQLMKQMGLAPGAPSGDVGAPVGSPAPSQPDFSSQIQNLENQVERLKTENSTLRTDLNKARRDLTAARSGSGSGLLGTAASAVAGAVAGAVVGRATATRSANTGAGEQQAIIAGLNEQINDLRVENRALQAENQRLRTENEGLQRDVGLLTARIQKLEATIEDRKI